MKTSKILLGVTAGLLVPQVAMACGPSGPELVLMMAVISPVLLLLASPLLFGMVQLVRWWRVKPSGRRFLMAQLLLSAACSAVGFWGGVVAEAWEARVFVFGYGLAAAALAGQALAQLRSLTQKP